MVKINKEQRDEIKPYWENLGLLLAIYNKLLKVHKKTIDEFDKKHYILNSKKMKEEKPFIWTLDGNIIIDPKFLNKLDDKSKKDLLFIKDEITKDFKEKILPLVNLPAHFLPYYWNFVAYADIDAPTKNFSINFHPIDPEYDLVRKMNQGTQYISLNIYKPLSTLEKKKVLSLVESMGKKAFPKYIKEKLKFTDDLTLDLRVFNDSVKRERPKSKKIYASYLKALHREFERGAASLKTFNKMKKNRPFDVTSEIIGGFTSEDIGKVYNLSDANVRKIVERYKNKISLYVN